MEKNHIDGTPDRVCSCPIKNFLMGAGERSVLRNNNIKNMEDKQYGIIRIIKNIGGTQ